MTIAMDEDQIATEILTLFPQTKHSQSEKDISSIKNNLYGFAKALIKDKLEIDENEPIQN